MAEIEVAFDVLRSAVEASHGHTDVWMHLCEETSDGAKRIVFLTDAEFQAKPAGSVTPILRTKRPRNGLGNQAESKTTVTITFDGQPTRTFAPGTADALFWTEASIEKFFFPYYQRVLSPDEYEILRQSYYAPKPGEKPILAFVHYPPSIYGDLR